MQFLTELETKLAEVNRELEAKKAELGMLVKDWHTFLELPYGEQLRLRELCPERISQLERDFFRKFEAPR